jgi:hypothetical protein
VNQQCNDGVAGTGQCECIPGTVKKYDQDSNWISCDIDMCASSPCENGGTCIDGLNSYSCVCVSGFNDVNCTTNINDCIPYPCLNSGMCIDGIDSYVCDCPFTHYGVNCTLESSNIYK